ncbi:MAG TPA: NAD(P)-binding domain-containing protein [Candidatus Angelobacter sp.]|nr:NAD(P)-binding domain-containing protein [Candidatus Angelobacter sp.]
MKIGIIGAGHIGGTLTRRFSALGHKVFVATVRSKYFPNVVELDQGVHRIGVPKSLYLLCRTLPQLRLHNVIRR